MNMEKIITIDGLASSGKSTLSCLVAKKLNWSWFSTGVLYRGMAYIGSKENFTDQNYLQFFESKDWHIKLSASRSLFFYKDQNISLELYKPEIDDQASVFSASVQFRKALIPAQRRLCQNYIKTGLILEGRDCGTMIFPSAPLKIFLVAGEDIRAKRRSKDRSQTQEVVLQAQKTRDHRDQKRPFAPLVKPENSYILDSSKQSSQELTDFVYQKARKIFVL